ncbi:hypothetical protein F444_08651 [Phytophthora nicotianae P1976]|uniref:Uncharacterized protein n=1 Tax=Phytophthora nicotianae P1976 TaxID=1317066 RepID=A0A081AAC2_PHYNI|nr:hypothetical protein F444_08651 [Phytophthora nicotianae P1976]
MSDPFDFLNPIASTKTPAEKVLSQPHHAPVGVPPAPMAPMNVGMGMGMGMPAPQGNMGMGMNMNMNMNMGAPPAFNGGGVPMNMGGMLPHGGMMPGQFPGAPGMGLGMNQPVNPFGQPPAQQGPMYDNIKKLLEKKPAVDDASMDFLENLGGGAKSSSNPSLEPVRSPEPVAPVNPFGAPQAPAELDFSILGGGAPPSSAPVQPASPASGTKSSALASRLAHGKRPTQEAARKNLGFNAGAFSGSGHAKISLKTVAGGTISSTSNGEPTLDDFVAGNAPLAPVDDIFAATPTNPPANPAASSSNDIFW